MVPSFPNSSMIAKLSGAVSPVAAADGEETMELNADSKWVYCCKCSFGCHVDMGDWEREGSKWRCGERKYRLSIEEREKEDYGKREKREGGGCGLGRKGG